LEKSYCQSDWRIGQWNAVFLSYIEEAKSKVWINAKTGIAMELAIKENKKKADLPVEKLIPEDLHDFLNVFNDNKANWFPESNMWDHKIDMKERFELKSFKNYNLTPEEQKELDKFLDKNLEKGYIQPSQSPQASSSLLKRKMKDFNHVKTISIWTTAQLKMHILHLWFQKSWTSWKEQSVSQNLTYDGAIIMFKSDLEMNGKPHSKQIEDYINPLSCSLECVIPQQHFKPWWTRYPKTKLKKIWLLSIWTTFWHFPNNWWPWEIILEKAREYDLYFKAKKCKFRKPKIRYL
jgi:hypothetical protein